MIEELNWKQAYDLPLKLDEYGPYAWTNDGTMALQFKNVSKQDRVKIINSINKHSDLKIEGLTNKSCDFYINNELAFYVRGWGYLTGSGALNLPKEKAIEIQNGFIDHISNCLKSNTTP